MVGQLVAAQFALEGALAEFAGNSGALGQAQLQLTMLATLRQQIGTASPATLSAMSNEIVGAVAQAQGIVQQARTSAANGEASAASSAAKARQALQSVADDLFGKKLLDPYLEFTSAKDEEEYRKRERERDTEIKRLLALDTPQANRQATALIEAQLKDAGAHGADRAPQFATIAARIEGVNNDIGNASPRLQAEESRTAVPQEISGIAATLRAAGLSTPDGNDQPSGHGLSMDKLLAQVRSAEGRV